MSEVTHELFIHHASWCPNISWKKFMKTFSRCLDAVKRKTEQKLIIFPCPHTPPYLIWRKIGTQSHSAKFLNWGDHVNSVPDLAASPPWTSDSHTNTVICHTFAYSSRWRRKPWQEALPGGAPMSLVWILKRLVSVFINASRRCRKLNENSCLCRNFRKEG